MMKHYGAALIGIGGILLGAQSAHGADVILFQLRQANVQISRQDFEAFAETGEFPPHIQQELGFELSVPPSIHQLLARPIRLPSSAENFLNSDTGEFLLNQLDRWITPASGQSDQTSSFLKATMLKVVKQQQVSFLDLVRQYPQSDVRVDLTGLENTYDYVVQWVEQIQTDSNGTKQFLVDLLCKCDPTASRPASHCFETSRESSSPVF